MQIEHTSIHLEKIRFYAYHGVMPQENLVGTYFLVTLHIDTDYSQAVETDDLAGTVSYADIYNSVKEEMQMPSKLLEHVAGRIAKKLYLEFPSITGITVRVDKENPPMGAQCESCGIELSTKR